MRKCSKCGQLGPDSDYYASCRWVCKVCVRLESRANRAKKLDHYRAKERERKARPSAIEKASTRTSRWRREHKERFAAQQKLRYAVRVGRVERPEACQRCGVAPSRIEAHHWDYSKPLDVEWLCKPCHAKADQERRAA